MKIGRYEIGRVDTPYGRMWRVQKDLVDQRGFYGTRSREADSLWFCLGIIFSKY